MTVVGRAPWGGRVLVVGGGGVAGIAWAAGVMAALAQRGLDLAAIDGFVGTSAGAVVVAQLAAGLHPQALLENQRQPSPHEQFRAYSQSEADARNRQLVQKVGGDLSEARRRIGAFALRSPTPTVAQRRAIIVARLGDADWPAHRWLGVVAVDAETGEGCLFDAGSGVPLVDAVAASCAVPGVWPPTPIAGRRFVDGGVRSLTNADAAAGARAVLVLAPLGDGDGNPVGGHLAAEAAQLRASGADVQILVPDAASREALGDNVLDPARRRACADAGFAQGLALPACRDWLTTPAEQRPPFPRGEPTHDPA